MYRKTLGQQAAKWPILRWRIVVVLLLASLLPLALASFGSWTVFGRLLEQRALELMRTIVESHARAIESDLSQRLHLLQLLAETRSLEDVGNPDRLGKLLTGLNNSSQGSYVDLGVIGSDGGHLAYVGPYDLQDRNYRETAWFKEVTATGMYISDVFLGYRQVPHCIIAVKTMRDGQWWILRATINSERFDALVKTGVLGEGGDAYIVNRDGLYQTTPRNGSILDRAPDSLIEFHSGVQDRRIAMNGAVKIRVTTWINDNRWMLAVEQDLAAIKAPVTQAIAKGAQVVIVAVVFLIVITFLATWHLTSQIDKANAQRDEMSRAFIRSAKLASIGELATGLAHEINNPLAIISAEQTNFSDMVGEAAVTPEQRGLMLDSVERCKKQIQRCAGITRKMLQFGRKSETTLEPTDLAPRLHEIADLMRRHAQVRNVDLVLEVQNDLPQVLVDPIELEQVLVNLINNSLAALPKGGRILIGATREKDFVQLAVKDNGAGIPPQELDLIFEPFYTTKPVGKGTGLGLSVCYGIVHSWGGRIKAESAPGTGTTMFIRLPLPDATRADDRAGG